MKTITKVELVGRRGEKARITKVRVETYTVWGKDEAGRVVEMAAGLGYAEAKAEREALAARNAGLGRTFTFLPCGTHPRRMGW